MRRDDSRDSEPVVGRSSVCVTRHPALVEYLREIGLACDQVIAHAAPADVAGRDVIGVLPLHLAALAGSVIEVPLNVPAEMRGRELTLAEIRQYAERPVRYQVFAYRACPECGAFDCDGCE